MQTLKLLLLAAGGAIVGGKFGWHSCLYIAAAYTDRIEPHVGGDDAGMGLVASQINVEGSRQVY